MGLLASCKYKKQRNSTSGPYTSAIMTGSSIHSFAFADLTLNQIRITIIRYVSPKQKCNCAKISLLIFAMLGCQITLWISEVHPAFLRLLDRQDHQVYEHQHFSLKHIWKLQSRISCIVWVAVC